MKKLFLINILILSFLATGCATHKAKRLESDKARLEKAEDKVSENAQRYVTAAHDLITTVPVEAIPAEHQQSLDLAKRFVRGAQQILGMPVKPIPVEAINQLKSQKAVQEVQSYINAGVVAKQQEVLAEARVQKTEDKLVGYGSRFERYRNLLVYAGWVFGIYIFFRFAWPILRDWLMFSFPGLRIFFGSVSRSAYEHNITNLEHGAERLGEQADDLFKEIGRRMKPLYKPYIRAVRENNFHKPKDRVV